MSLQKNQAQEEAIRTIDGPVLLVSCPGSGKTTTLVRRIHHMIESGVPSGHILMVTFTAEAARNMRAKYESMYPGSPGVIFATIHSMCYNILLREGLCSPGKVVQVRACEEFMFNFFKARRVDGDAFEMGKLALSQISVAKNNYLDPSGMNVSGISTGMLSDAYRAYQEWLESIGCIDFDDMLLLCHKFLTENPEVLLKYRGLFRYIQCDEYQDTNYVQRDILYLLAGEDKNLCVVGDDDQSIYAFRGARPEIMLGFQKDFPEAKVIYMGTNYRSANSVVSAAGNLIANNKDRFSKEFSSFRGDCTDSFVTVRSYHSRKDEMAELVDEIRKLHMEGMPYREMAILFRTNEQAASPVSALSDAGIPYYSTESAKTIYESFIFQDIRNYVSLSSGNGDSQTLLSVLNHPNRYLREAHFHDCEYSENGLLHAISYIASRGQRWQYEKAEKAIGEWMDAFGPGKVSMNSRPSAVMLRMDGPDPSIHYDVHLRNYAEYRNMDYSELREKYQAIEEDAKEYSTVREWFEHADNYTAKIREEMRRKDRDGVTVATMHKAKGLEWKAVFIIDADENVTPYKRSLKSQAEIEEERRLFYVAMTRAKDLLFVMHTGYPSRFIREFRTTPKKTTVRKRIPASEVHKCLAGTPVEHRKFGRGFVLSFEPGKVCVHFDDHGNKKFTFPESFQSGMLKYISAGTS